MVMPASPVFSVVTAGYLYDVAQEEATVDYTYYSNEEKSP
jgi:hypothetical protein